MGRVGAKRTRRRPPAAAALACSGAFEIATSPAGTVSVTSNGVLNRGSSKHGNARRASTASNCVDA